MHIQTQRFSPKNTGGSSVFYFFSIFFSSWLIWWEHHRIRLAIYKFAINGKWLVRFMCLSDPGILLKFFASSTLSRVGYMRCRSELFDHTHAFGMFCRVGTKQHMAEMVSLNFIVKVKLVLHWHIAVTSFISLVGSRCYSKHTTLCHEGGILTACSCFIVNDLPGLHIVCTLCSFSKMIFHPTVVLNGF